MAYVFDHEWTGERQRLRALETVRDPWTIHHLDTIGVQEGWRCLELGAGGGSIAEWLCDAVGDRGRVVATDLETRFLEASKAPNLEVRRHDIVADPLEHAAFDLIHCRALLEHLPQRDEVLSELLAALRPDGWLLLEDGDFLSLVPSPLPRSTIIERVLGALKEVMVERGFDPRYGRRLGSALRQAGLVDVVMEGLVVEWGAGRPLTAFFALTIERLRDVFLDSGRLCAEEIDRFGELVRAPEFAALSHTLFSARGRKPSASD